VRTNRIWQAWPTRTRRVLLSSGSPASPTLYAMRHLRLPNPIDSGAADWTRSLSCWPTVTQGHSTRILDLAFGSALEAVCFHESLLTKAWVHANEEQCHAQAPWQRRVCASLNPAYDGLAFLIYSPKVNLVTWICRMAARAVSQIVLGYFWRRFWRTCG